jgi:hypothetical protein
VLVEKLSDYEVSAADEAVAVKVIGEIRGVSLLTIE